MLANLYKFLVRPLLFRLDPEKCHKLAIEAGKLLGTTPLKKLTGLFYKFDDERLHSTFCGMEFKNPVGLAAGFDKNGELTEIVPYLGFGFEEVGSVTARKCRGNPGKVIVRLPKDKALMNNIGLKNNGSDATSARLSNKKFEAVIGINIAKTHDPAILGKAAVDDICYSFEKLYDIGDYLTINISCPNTTEGKTFEDDPEALDTLLCAVGNKRKAKKPLLVKFSPDISYDSLDALLEVCERHGVDGYVISNTSLDRSGLRTEREKLSKIGKKGLSGKPVNGKSTEMIGYIYQRLKDTYGKKNPQIIGVGGIFSAEDAYGKIKAGASLVQLYTGLVYEGPGLVKQINRNLVKLIGRDGYKSIMDAVGAKHRR